MDDLFHVYRQIVREVGAEFHLDLQVVWVDPLNRAGLLAGTALLGLLLVLRLKLVRMGTTSGVAAAGRPGWPVRRRAQAGIAHPPGRVGLG